MRIVIRNLQTEKRALARTRLSGCGRSASEEMQEQHHYPDYQHDVNEAAGNVKGQEPKQPKNNQDRDLMKLNRFKIERLDFPVAGEFARRSVFRARLSDYSGGKK